MKMTKKEVDQQPDGKGSISAAITEALSCWTFNDYDGWMQSSTVMRNPGMLLWLLGASSAGAMDYVMWIRLRRMVDWMACTRDPYIFDERGFTTMDDIATLKSMHAAATFTIMDEDAYDGSNKEYNDTTIPADSL
ncbi:predicted protein [Lichtheimia corymbifera JMRC:FSU:9682]|uniref:Uncharacterized protein n=1 Tax=Lichtheimia corymbifera JMRC:FSU:9682 TaxID=1263082 RepID=A0A068SDX4_9FUNG|nr:predicted protein [Lichtheimia corymbifera JMRC:FSU:9682]